VPGTRCDARTDASKQGAKSVPGAWCDARSSYVSQGQSPSFSSTWCNRKHAYRVSKRGGRFAGSLNEARWFYAPTGRKPMRYVPPFQGVRELGRRRTQVASAPRMPLRSTLGDLMMPRWGERSGCGSVLIANRRR
jgi:hypothetical protein